MTDIEWPVLIHCESGRKALLERAWDSFGNAYYMMSYWRRWSNIWVEIESPLP